jgi:thiaminase/transcriptional activator TenA
VGEALERAGSRDPLYSRWIGTYASEEFGSVVRAVLECTDALAGRLREDERQAMRRHFVTTSLYEWMFWDMGWRREGWPV